MESKGLPLGNCNRSACLTSHDVVFYHRLNGNYYCRECARKINTSNRDFDGKDLCLYDIAADVDAMVKIIKENSSPDKYSGDEENRRTVIEHLFQCLPQSTNILIRSNDVIEAYLNVTNYTVRENDILVDPDDILADEVTLYGLVVGQLAPRKIMYPNGEVQYDLRKAVMPSFGTFAATMFDYGKFEMLAYASAISNNITGTLLPLGEYKQKSKSRLFRKFEVEAATNYLKQSSASVGIHEMRLIEDDKIDTKIDYKARYKRHGDVIRDVATGDIIPLRKCPQHIKRGLGIK